MEGCDLCQRMKNRMEELAGKLKLSEVPEKPWTYLMVDFITKLLVVVGKDAVRIVGSGLSFFSSLFLFYFFPYLLSYLLSLCSIFSM